MMLAQHVPALSPGRRRPPTDAALDLEALALAAGSDYEDANCGVSFFSLLVADDELECYCSGECKWSVVMYRKMDRRVRALRRHLRAVAASKPAASKLTAPAANAADSPVGSATSSSATWASTTSTDSDSYDSCSPLLDDVIACH